MLANEASPLPEGSVYRFPLPFGTMFVSAKPEIMTLNDAMDTLSYSVTYPERVTLPMAPGEESVLNEKGIYQYTADLATGKVPLKIIDGNHVTEVPNT